MFSFKARSISEYIANPVSSSTLIPANTVIFVADSAYMQTYPLASNWQFINVAQSDQKPSYIRGTTSITNAAKLYTRSTISSFTTVTDGSHAGTGLRTTNNVPINNFPNYRSGSTNTAGGSHAHSVSGLNASTSLGGIYHYGVVVGLYKCVNPTYEIPKGTLVFTKNPVNDDFVLDNFSDGRCLISGNSLFVATNTTYGGYYLYNEISGTVSTSGNHNHIVDAIRGNSTTINGSRVNGYTDGLGNLYGNHTHDLISIAGGNFINFSADVDPAYKQQKTYKTVRNTGAYKGMVLGWAGRSLSELPQGWYLCNGQIVNGFTTPNLNKDRCIMATTSDQADNTEGGTDKVTIKYQFEGKSLHGHGITDSGSVYVYPNNGPPAYHDSYDWLHGHSGENISTWKQGSYTLNFIIYLG